MTTVVRSHPSAAFVRDAKHERSRPRSRCFIVGAERLESRALLAHLEIFAPSGAAAVLVSSSPYIESFNYDLSRSVQFGDADLADCPCFIRGG